MRTTVAKINDNDIKFFKSKGEKFFQVNKKIVVKRYFLPAGEFTGKDEYDRGFCFVLSTKKDEKRFLKIAERQGLELFRLDMMFLNEFVENEMEKYDMMDFSDKPTKTLKILSTKCKLVDGIEEVPKKAKKGA